jgi:hypothetical protein
MRAAVGAEDIILEAALVQAQVEVQSEDTELMELSEQQVL